MAGAQLRPVAPLANPTILRRASKQRETEPTKGGSEGGKVSEGKETRGAMGRGKTRHDGRGKGRSSDTTLTPPNMERPPPPWHSSAGLWYCFVLANFTGRAPLCTPFPSISPLPVHHRRCRMSVYVPFHPCSATNDCSLMAHDTHYRTTGQYVTQCCCRRSSLVPPPT